MPILLRLCFSLVLLAPALVHAATLENPANGSFYSGIGVISGWKCTATGPLTVRFNDGDPLPLAYGNVRADVRNAGACPSAQVGFVSIMNWAELGDGTHTAVVYDNGVEFARSTFTVATTGEPYVTGAEGECRVPDFPAPQETMRFAWNQSTQHLEMADDSGRESEADDHGNTAQEATPVAVPSSTPGRIEPASDEDWFRLRVSNTGFLRLYPAGRGMWVKLWRGEDLREIRNYHEGRNDEVRVYYNGRDNKGNFFAHYQVVPDVYYAMVKNAGGMVTGPYRLDTRWTPNFQRGEDRHDPPAQAAMATATAAAEQGVLENPATGSFYSGIGVISGWKCTATGPLTVRFNDGDPLPLAYGNVRADVRNAGACPSAQVGFVSIMNWAELGDGTHTAVVYDNGVEFARSTFTVATTGEPYVTGAEGECRVPDFPASGESAWFAWNQSTQHLEMVNHHSGGGGPAALGPPWSEATTVRLSSDTRGILSSDIRGTLEQADDVNYYRIDIPRAGTVTVDTTGNTDTVGQLRTSPDSTGSDGTDPDGRLVGRADSGGEGTNFRISESLPAGTYYVLVSRPPTDARRPRREEYTLRIRFTPDPACAEDTVGDTPESAAIIRLDQTVRRGLECEADIDYFVINVPRAGILDVKTWDHEFDFLDVEYFDDSFTSLGLVLSKDWSGADDGTHHTPEIAAGQYYIRLMDDRLFPDIGPYTLQVRLHPRQDDHGDEQHEATELAIPSATPGIIETLSDEQPSIEAGRSVRRVFDHNDTDVDIFFVDLDAYENPSEGDFEGTLIIESEGDTDLVGKFIHSSGGEEEDLRGGEGARNIRIEFPLQGYEIGHIVKHDGWIVVAGHPDTVHNTGPYTLRVRVEESGTGAPGIPRNVRVAEVGEDFIVVDWDPPAGGGAVSYNVYSRVEGGTETLLGNVTTLGVQVTDINDTREICYRVAAVNAAGVEGEKSPEACGSVSPRDQTGGEGDICLLETAYERTGEGCENLPPLDYGCYSRNFEECEAYARELTGEDRRCGHFRSRVVRMYESSESDECWDEARRRGCCRVRTHNQ